MKMNFMDAGGSALENIVSYTTRKEALLYRRPLFLITHYFFLPSYPFSTGGK